MSDIINIDLLKTYHESGTLREAALKFGKSRNTILKEAKKHGITFVDGRKARDTILDCVPTKYRRWYSVYIIEAKGLGVYKIGRTQNFYDRFCTIRSHTPCDLVPLYVFPIESETESLLVEKALLTWTDDSKTHGEWRTIDETLGQAVSRLSKFENLAEVFMPLTVVQQRRVNPLVLIEQDVFNIGVDVARAYHSNERFRSAYKLRTGRRWFEHLTFLYDEEFRQIVIDAFYETSKSARPQVKEAS